MAEGLMRTSRHELFRAATLVTSQWYQESRPKSRTLPCNERQAVWFKGGKLAWADSVAMVMWDCRSWMEPLITLAREVTDTAYTGARGGCVSSPQQAHESSMFLFITTSMHC